MSLITVLCPVLLLVGSTLVPDCALQEPTPPAPPSEQPAPTPVQTQQPVETQQPVVTPPTPEVKPQDPTPAPAPTPAPTPAPETAPPTTPPPSSQAGVHPAPALPAASAAMGQEEAGLKVTRRSATIGGQALEYVARAGTLPIQDEAGKTTANVFFVDYVRSDVADPSTRPLMFSFNGGPGSSSVWLHLGALGPRRVSLDNDGWAPQPPYRLVDNEHSWLDHTDLVFIDPVSTGFSRPADGEAATQFHGLEEDARAVGEFIRLYTTRFRRWESPKFLAGESYGTTRAARLADYLQERHGMYLNGLVLVSTVLDFQTTRFDVGNDLPYVLFLPTYAATAWYHHKLGPEAPKDLRVFLDEVEAFARGEYATALLKGRKLTPEERERLVAKLGRYTGLSHEFIERANLRVSIGRFTKELMRGQRRTVGRLDSRFQGIDLDSAGESYEYDPSYAAILGPFSGALNQYVRTELGYESDLPYEILTSKVQPWPYPDRNRYASVAESLRKAMTRNPHLKVLIASGYFDLATPYHAAAYTADHLGLDASLEANLKLTYYESGHMMYIHQPSHLALKQDVAAFLQSALPKR